jgi:hypothetical protein
MIVKWPIHSLLKFHLNVTSLVVCDIRYEFILFYLFHKSHSIVCILVDMHFFVYKVLHVKCHNFAKSLSNTHTGPATSFLIKFGAHMKNLSTIQLKILVLTKWLYMSPPFMFIIDFGSEWDNTSHSHHRRKCLLDCFGGQLDANTRISTGYAQNLPDHWD